MNDVLKQNTNLNDEIMVKAEIISLLRNTGSQENEMNNETSDDEIEEIEIESSECDTERMKAQEKPKTDKQCDECGFKTTTTKLKVHMKAHTGQYQCLRGCKLEFKTLGGLDEHLKTKHSAPKKAEIYLCDKSKTYSLIC